ncbi:CoA-binding protein [Fimicolochytrium jonesii]|uniref:CoA-binding protein n=1 Tax=Fimicolochytrium jonesii TaxID=1396493 RepID=UPI0022FE3352|nr:CoA-binding protein [Fimicolochytrium jonesii]KAI8824113.1 CoA-binding protein [Fimicolochytrium jonesii]
MSSLEASARFFQQGRFAVVGASADPAKFGNKVFRWYLDHKLSVVPINPSTPTIENHTTAAKLSTLTDPASYSVSVITPPKITKNIIQEAADLGIKNVWLQPGAESEEALALGREKGLNVISGGPCVLVHGEEAIKAASKL